MNSAIQVMKMSWPLTKRRNEQGALEFGGVSVVDLVQQFGTPLYVFDEKTLRARAISIRQAFATVYERSRIVFAGKAYLSPALMSILVQEHIGLDVVSGGEIYAGLAAGVDPATMIFHGNNKSRGELEEAVAANVGLIAIDNDLEIALLESVAAILRKDVSVLLRLNPGVEPHTHDKMRTGARDSKFGFPVWDGQAARAAATVIETKHLKLVGYHAHVGSQIFDPTLVRQTIAAIMEFGAEVRDRHGVAPDIIVPGGGFGVADDASGADVSIERWAEEAADAIREECTRHGLLHPILIVEPGRTIIGPAGIAIYTVGARKVVSSARTYVSVDGGMADNIRPALYGAQYTAELANREGSGETLETITIAGKYCESGDILIDELSLPPLNYGDLLAVPMAGAYCLAMASNYNLAPRPAAVLVNGGQVRMIRRRETHEDMLLAEVFETCIAQSDGD